MTKALELARRVLNENDNPMTVKEIYEYAVQELSDVVEQTFNGATPMETLGANLYVNVKKQDSLFLKFKEGSTTRFGLKSKKYSDSIINIMNEETEKIDYQNDNTFMEKDLHKYLVSYMDECYCKTINANKSEIKIKNKNKYMHPDIIGVKFLKEYYEKATMDLMKLNNESPFELYSFEMKQEINLSFADEYFSQAATNSSWANYGYIVAMNINTEDSDLMEKLERLNKIFGIGVIKIDVKTYSNSKKIFESKSKSIDYDLLDNLLTLNNSDINDFFNEIMAICADLRTSVVSDVFDKPFESDIEGEEYAKSKGLIF